VDVEHLVTPRPAPCAVLDHVATRGDRVRFRVRQPDGSWLPVTWRAFAQQIRAVAAGLIGRGIGRGDCVAVFGTNSVAWAAAALGVQAAGATMVPIYPASTGEAARYVLEHAEVTTAFVSTAQRPALTAAGLDVRAIGLDDGTWADFVAGGEHSDRLDPSVVDGRVASIALDDVGLMLYTSGTSGPPKGVPLSHANVGINGADWLRSNAPLLAPDDRDLLWLPFSHIFGWGELCSGNIIGWESWMCSPAEVMTVFPEVAPHVFLSVPAYWEKLTRAVDAAAGPDATADRETRRASFAAITGGNLRFALSGGAGLKREIKEQLKELGLVVIEGYGLTETSPTLTLNRPDRYRFDSVGLPLPSLELGWPTTARSWPAAPTCSAATTRTPRPPPARSPPTAGSDRRHRPLHRRRLPADRRSQEGHPGHRRRQERAAGQHRGSLRQRSGHRAGGGLRRRKPVPGGRGVARAQRHRRRRRGRRRGRARQRQLAKFETIKKFWIATSRSRRGRAS
jgi:long-chain acyl-CoA synthetase